MGLSKTWRIFLIAALLLAQQSSVVHQIWHGSAGAASVALQPTGDAGKGNPLCDQHAALKAVLAALNGNISPVVLAEVAAVRPPAPALPSPSLPGLAPSSRDPPAFL